MEALENLSSNEDEKALTKEEVMINKDRSIAKLNSLIESLANSPDTLKKANNLAYWISQYSTCISFEKQFDSKRLKRYKRGDVIKVHLGFNIGNELGGLHYCVVLDTKNDMGSGTITVVPLTSSKEDKEYHSSTVNLGEEIYLNLKNYLLFSQAGLYLFYKSLRSFYLSLFDFLMNGALSEAFFLFLNFFLASAYISY